MTTVLTDLQSEAKEKYRKLVFDLAANKDVARARITEVCVLAGRTPDDLGNHVNIVRQRRQAVDDLEQAKRRGDRAHVLKSQLIDQRQKFEDLQKRVIRQVDEAQARLEALRRQSSMENQALHTLRNEAQHILKSTAATSGDYNDWKNVSFDT